MKKRSLLTTAILFLSLLFLGFWGCAQGKKNHNPVITSLKATPATLAPEATASLVADADDDDDDTLEYKWTAYGGRLSNDKGTSVSWTAPNTYGFYRIEVTVNDGEAKVHSSITIPVTDDPKITGVTYNTTAAVSTDVALSITYTPANPVNPLTISWSATGGSFNTTSGTPVTWTAPASAGNYDLTVNITDGVKNDSRTVRITVS